MQSTLNASSTIEIQDIISISQTPASLKTVISVPGRVTPVVDRRVKFGLPSNDDSQRRCIIVVQVNTASTVLLTGTAVDEVSELIPQAAADREDTPDSGTNLSTSNILEMAKIKILLGIDQVLSSPKRHGIANVIQ